MPLSLLPVFFDLADGLPHNEVQNGVPVVVQVGTPTPNSVITQSSGANGLPTNDYGVEEEPDSPELERAEQATITKRFNCSWENATTYVQGLGRGTILEDSFGNVIRILSSRIQRKRSNNATVTIVSEGLSFDTPPDEFGCSPVDLGINIVKDPRYFIALNPLPSDSAVVQSGKQMIIRAIQTYQDSPFFPTPSNIAALTGSVHDLITSLLKGGSFTYNVPNSTFDSTQPATPIPPVGVTVSSTTYPNPPYFTVAYDPTTAAGADVTELNYALAAAMEIISKLWKQEDNPYLVGFKIVWSVYYYRPPLLSPGGYVQDPITGTGADNPGLPDFFYSTASPPNTSDTIFDGMASFNPQCYSSDGTSGGFTAISWLREADDIQYERTWFKITRSWVGSAIGNWDLQLYNQNNRPVNGNPPTSDTDTTHYLQLAG